MIRHYSEIKQQLITHIDNAKVTRLLLKKDIAEMLGMSTTGFYQMLNQGESIKLDVFIKLCEILEIHPFKILSDTPFSEIPNELGIENKYLHSVIADKNSLIERLDRQIVTYEKLIKP